MVEPNPCYPRPHDSFEYKLGNLRRIWPIFPINQIVISPKMSGDLCPTSHLNDHMYRFGIAIDRRLGGSEWANRNDND